MTIEDHGSSDSIKIANRFASDFHRDRWRAHLKAPLMLQLIFSHV